MILFNGNFHQSTYNLKCTKSVVWSNRYVCFDCKNKDESIVSVWDWQFSNTRVSNLWLCVCWMFLASLFLKTKKTTYKYGQWYDYKQLQSLIKLILCNTDKRDNMPRVILIVSLELFHCNWDIFHCGLFVYFHGVFCCEILFIMLAENGIKAHCVIGWITDNIVQLSLSLIVYDGLLLCGLCGWIYGMCIVWYLLML